MAYSRYFQRVCRLQMTLFEGDTELMVIAGAIGLAAVEHRVREAGFKAQFGNIEMQLGLEGQRGTNVQSVADTTGLPRETVRRKIAHLVRMGIVARRGSGDYVMQPGALQSAPFMEVLSEISDETVRMINECLENGSLIVIPSGA